jgi:hypothetical protein
VLMEGLKSYRSVCSGLAVDEAPFCGCCVVIEV